MRKLISLVNAFYIAAALAALPVSGGVVTEPPRDERFRILFEPGVQTLPQRGPDAAANEAALSRMARAVEQIGDLTALHLVFLAARPACVSPASCDADHFTGQRVQEIVAAIRSHARKAGIAIPSRDINVRFVFPCEHCVIAMSPPPAPHGSEALVLLLDQVVVNRASNSCQVKILLRDPGLPPLMDAPAEHAAIPVAAGARVSMGPDARIAIAAGPAQVERMVWEDGKGRFRKAARPAEELFQPIPKGAVRLYELPAEGENAEVDRFLASIGETFTLAHSFIAAQVSVAGEKGAAVAELDATGRAAGDNVRPVRPRTVRPKEKPRDRSAAATSEAPVRVCQYEFAAAPPLDANPSR